MFYHIKNTKQFYVRKINNYLFYGLGFTLLYYNPYLFLNSIIFILLFNNINVDLKINNENTIKIPYFDINGVIKEEVEEDVQEEVEKEVEEDVQEEVEKEVEEEVQENVKKEVQEEVEEVEEDDDYEEDEMGNKYKRRDRYFTKI